MDDYISRQALLDKFEQWQKNDGYSNGEWNLLVDVLSVIKSMPPAPQLGTNLAEVGTDLISRAQAIDALDQIFDRCEEIEAHLPEGDPDRTGYKMYPDYMTVWKYLHQLPSAQPEIIRCKDCKYARLTNDGSCKYCDIWFPDEAEYMDGDYYCASAERKSNG